MNSIKFLVGSIVVLMVITLAASGLLWLLKYIYTQNQSDFSPQSDYKNVSYFIEDELVKLVNGYSEIQPDSGSASKIITQYFGNEATGDLNGDGLRDVAFILTQNSGGSGTFYYVVAALKTSDGYRGTNGILLGDRIAPQTTEVSNSVITVNYATRRPDEPMTQQPSVGVSKYLVLENGVLREQSALASFSMPVHLSLGQKVVFDDGLSLVLVQIDDSRCKSGMVCVWAGELSAKFSVVGGSIRQALQEFVLGTLQIREKTIGGYVFLLDVTATTETTATTTVTKEVARQTGGCYIGGCSGQICSSQKDIVSTCEYSEKYACYKTAMCERQANGQCGWTQTAELKNCLEK